MPFNDIGTGTAETADERSILQYHQCRETIFVVLLSWNQTVSVDTDDHDGWFTSPAVKLAKLVNGFFNGRARPVVEGGNDNAEWIVAQNIITCDFDGSEKLPRLVSGLYIN